jgi:hypothetical protein
MDFGADGVKVVGQSTKSSDKDRGFQSVRTRQVPGCSDDALMSDVALQNFRDLPSLLETQELPRPHLPNRYHADAG